MSRSQTMSKDDAMPQGLNRTVAILCMAGSLTAVGAARASEGVPASATIVRDTVVAMAMADAALPAASAISVSPEVAAAMAAVPAAASKRETSPKFAATQAPRRYASRATTSAWYERRPRVSPEPFVLILGIGF